MDQQTMLASCSNRYLKALSIMGRIFMPHVQFLACQTMQKKINMVYSNKTVSNSIRTIKQLTFYRLIK